MVSLLFNWFLNVLTMAGIFCTLMGLFVLVVTLILPKKSPMDTSNRLNHLTLVWYALSQPQTFVELYYCETDEDAPDCGVHKLAFPWLMRDQGGNTDGVI